MRRAIALGLVLASLLLCAPRAAAYSVLAHEATVDAAWDDLIVPILRQRYRGLTSADLDHARAFAYGGSLIQDLGYYPFGSRLFTNLTHYVRSGDFVESLIRNANGADELAFALGALAHYNADNSGHPGAVNRAVPLMYPKVRREVGNEALYVDSPSRHLMVEFSFDVSQVARGEYKAQAFRDRIGFEVAKPLLERATAETYGLELKDVFLDTDLAIGTFRYAVGTTIPEMTRIAWREKRKEIEERTPGVTQASFVFDFPRRKYDSEFGTKYQKPGPFSRMLAFVVKVLPKVGPLRALAFEPLSPEAERLFLESAAATRTRYRANLTALRAGKLDLSNTDFDTGQPSARGRNRLSDETYVALLDKLAGRDFAAVSPQLRRAINQHFAARPSAEEVVRRSAKTEERVRRQLAALNRLASAA
jgi:hypothetical protein